MSQTAMPESLSSAALAVLKTAGIYHGLFNEEIVQRRRMVAAALRAAADQLTPYSVEDMPGAAFCRNKLLAIATELEAQ